MVTSDAYTILNIEFRRKSFNEGFYLVAISWGEGGGFQWFESFKALDLFY